MRKVTTKTKSSNLEIIKMAEGTSVDKSDCRAEEFHDIETRSDNAEPGKLTLLLKITQPGNDPLPVGVIMERSLKSLVKQVTNVDPLAITIMNDVDSVLEFAKGVRIFEVAQLLHNVATWDKYNIEVGTLMSTKPQIVRLVRDKEQVREETKRAQQKQQTIIEEEKAYREDIQELLDRFENQVQRIEISHKSSLVSGPSDPGPVQTPDIDVGSETSQRHKLFKQPVLPRFSGSTPVPKGEGSYEQYMFQIKGFRAAYTDETIKSGIIGSMTDAARDYIEYVGFNKNLTAIIDALEQRYGQGLTTDKIQQEFYQIGQDKGEQVQQFAGRLELKYKKLIGLFPD